MDRSVVVPFETLHFLGRMNVHLTHELQNVMATISETSGLLDDLVDLFSAGADMDRKRLSKLTGRIVQEIDRGHKLVSHINTLAHSVDEAESEVDLTRVVRFMAYTAPCLPNARPIELDINLEELKAVIRPYLLEHLLYAAIRYAFQGLEPDQGIGLKLSSQDNTAEILFTGLALGKEFPGFPDAFAQKALDTLQATASLDRDRGALALTLPLDR